MRSALIGTALTFILAAGCDRQADAPPPDNAVEPADASNAQAPTDPEIVEGLSGRTARVELADGRTIFVTHRVDGTARMTGENTTEMEGRWSVSGGQLCFDWPEQARECWPYAGPLEPGIPVRSTSDRGQIITTTLQDDGPTAAELDGNVEPNTARNTAAPAE